MNCIKITQSRVLINGELFEINGALLDILDNIAMSDGFERVTKIYNAVVRIKLERLGVIRSSEDGYSARGENFDEFYTIVEELGYAS